MKFTPIDTETWERKEHYDHFMNEVVCTYSVVIPLDITRLKGQRLYPAMLWLLTRAVNRVPQFRTALTEQGLGVYDEMHPAYTVLNGERETFSCVWTAYREDYSAFLEAYEADAALGAASNHYVAKEGRPENSFDVSMIPWLSFTGFNLNLPDSRSYLLPIFTIGKYEDKEGKRILPLAVQVHHAVCDGLHVGRFAEILQEEIDRFPCL